MGLLDGLEKLGLKNLNTDKLYEKESDSAPKAKEKEVEKKEPQVFNEADYVFRKSYVCPVCDSPISSPTVKSSKARIIGTEKDLKPIYEGFEPIKYEAVVCPTCGYAVMGRYLAPLTPSQKKSVIENISSSFEGTICDDDIFSYEEAIERTTLALASAMVKRSKASEKAYICLKTGWLYRSFKQSLDVNAEDYDAACEELNKKEKEFLDSAYEGFIQARQSERYPIAGMDEMTLDCLLAVLAFDRNELEVSSKMVASILQSSTASSRIKEKARDLKEEIVNAIRSKKASN